MPFHVTCICGQQSHIPDDRAGEVVRCSQCDRELVMPVVDGPLPPPLPVADSQADQPAIVVDTRSEARTSARGARERHRFQAVGWSLMLLALINAVPVLTAVLQLQATSWIAHERWALGILVLSVLQLCYAIYVLQLPDQSSARVVSYVTLAIAGLYAIVTGIRMLAAPGNRIMESLELDSNIFSSRRETLWCFAVVLLTGTVSYLASRAARDRQITR